MATNDISLNVVGSAPVLPAITPGALVTTGGSGGTASQPQLQLWHPSSDSSGGSSSGAQQNGTHVQQQQIENALKNTGVKAEFENEQGLGMIVRLVEADSGQLLMQLPPQAVLDLVAQVTSEIDLEMSKETQAPNFSGRNIDQVA